VWNRVEIWLGSIATLYAVLWLIRELHIQIGRRMPDGNLKRLLLRDFYRQRTTVSPACRVEPSNWEAQQGLSTDIKPKSFIRRSFEETKRDPVFRWFLIVVYGLFAPAVVAGVCYGLYLLLALSGLV